MSPLNDVLVSVCLPVRNGASRLLTVAQSVLAQDHENLELIISDNASTDDTEEVCRALAAEDSRVVYHRNPENIGLMNNFISAMHHARGTFFRWVGDDDWLEPNCISRCLEVYATDERLVLVTTGAQFIGEDDEITATREYDGARLLSDDPIERLTEMLRLLNSSFLLIDPLYGLARREAIAWIPRRNMLREDQIFAAKMALAGPWGHINEQLYRRGFRDERRPELARRLGVPAWHARAANTLQGRELLRWVSEGAQLEPEQRRAARAAVRKWYVERQQIVLARRGRRIAQVAGLVPKRDTTHQPG
ncbi:glycosyltransferase family 2 protein [Dactylosporangium sp. NPDC048998]|uniref:glycosyltransferase family 2 protein n=1 Tax=Dactylosporangium sp. NPDC048998 TaxID=3363976 RepID=UPI00371A4F8A